MHTHTMLPCLLWWWQHPQSCPCHVAAAQTQSWRGAPRSWWGSQSLHWGGGHTGEVTLEAGRCLCSCGSLSSPGLVGKGTLVPSTTLHPTEIRQIWALGKKRNLATDIVGSITSVNSESTILSWSEALPTQVQTKVFYEEGGCEVDKRFQAIVWIMTELLTNTAPVHNKRTISHTPLSTVPDLGEGTLRGRCGRVHGPNRLWCVPHT